MTAGKTIALTRQNLVGKVMALLFNLLSSLVISFFSNEQVSFNFMTAVAICSDFGARLLGFKSELCHLQSVRHWSGYRLSVSICKVWVIAELSHRVM